MKQNENLCPHCGAAVQQNAAFCLHCMKSLDEKTEIKKKKTASKKLFIIAGIAVAIFAVALTVALTVKNRKVQPVCTAEQFLSSAAVTSEKLGCDNFWQPDKLTETHTNKQKNDSIYHTASSLSEAGVAVVFRNGGEVVDIAICDINDTDLDTAYLISESAVSAVLGYYSEDFANMMSDKNAYPRTALEKPFEEYFTDCLKRTAEYSKLAENGSISTEVLQVQTESGHIILCYFTNHTVEEDTLYDLYFEIQWE